MTKTFTADTATLPAYARSSINRCNYPAVILGSLTFQQRPLPLSITGVKQLHRQIFEALEQISDPAERAMHFADYMRSSFLLDNSDLAGLDTENQRIHRGKANYLRLLRGWMFDADSLEGAVMKRWVESRFGLLPRNHKGVLGDIDSASYQQYQSDFQRGLYNTNSLEFQIDLLYCYCQYELKRRFPDKEHWQLYRGINRVDQYDILQKIDKRNIVILLNNLNSFSDDELQASTFGDDVLSIAVPSAKLLYFPGLLPGVLTGESEFLVIGGVYLADIIN